MEEDKAPSTATGKGERAEHVETVGKTHTNIDVVRYTTETPYREVNFWGSYVAITLGCNAAFVGFLMPVTSLTLIQTILGPSVNAIWVSLAWVLSSSVAFILLGRLSDIFGRRWFFTGCSVLALIGSIIGATAMKIDTLIAASVFLGLGAAGQLSFNICLGELVPIRHRFLINGFIFFSVLPSSGLGPYIARVLIVNTAAGFRGIYYLAIALNGTATLCWFLFYHPPDFARLHRNRTVLDEVKEMDFGGIFLYVVGFFLFLLGLAWGGSLYPWSSAQVLAPLLIGLATFGVFIAYEKFANLRRPLVPMHLFKKDFVIINILNAVAGVVYYSANTLFPYMVAALYTTDPLEAGLVDSCISSGVCAGQFIGSLLAVPGGHLRLKLIFIACGLCAFVAALAGATGSQATGSALAVCAGFMVGLCEVIVATVVTIVIDDQSEIGVAGGIFGAIRSSAGVLATAIYASIFLNKSTDFTQSEVVPALIGAGLPPTSVAPFLTAVGAGNLVAVEQVPGITPSIVQVGVASLRQAYSDTFRIVWLATLAFGLLAVIASIFTNDIDDKLTRVIVRRLDGRTQRQQDLETQEKKTVYEE